VKLCAVVVVVKPPRKKRNNKTNYIFNLALF